MIKLFVIIGLIGIVLAILFLWSSVIDVGRLTTGPIIFAGFCIAVNSAGVYVGVFEP